MVFLGGLLIGILAIAIIVAAFKFFAYFFGYLCDCDCCQEF